MSHHHKHKDHEEVNSQEITDQNHTPDIEKKDLKPDDQLNDLIKQIDELNQMIVKKDLYIQELKNELEQINSNYIDKVNQKANEAQKIVSAKLEELTKKADHEISEARKYALMNKADNLVNVISQFEAAVNIPTTDEKIQKYLSGFVMFVNMFKTLLKELSINEIHVHVGDEFNPEFMEVIAFEEKNDLKENQVIRVVTKGYRLHDRLIKPTVVIVNRKKS